jgi:hypothetical protein
MIYLRIADLALETSPNLLLSEDWGSAFGVDGASVGEVEFDHFGICECVVKGIDFGVQVVIC